MNSPINYAIDDKELDDAALWAVIDSAAASLSSYVSSKSRKPLAIKDTNHIHFQSPRAKLTTSNPSPPNKVPKNPRNHNSSDGEVLQEPWSHHRPQKMARSSCVTELSETTSPPLVMVKHVQRTPTTPTYSSPDTRRFEVKEYSPIGSDCTPMSYGQCEEREISRHSLAGRFPSVSLFKEYQNAAMAAGGRYHFTSICLMKLKTTFEFDENRNVQRAEFVVRAHMQGGRFSDGWGSCERCEKRFMKPNHDIPSTAETRAKNKACQNKKTANKQEPEPNFIRRIVIWRHHNQDLLGIGEYRPGASHAHR